MVKPKRSVAVSYFSKVFTVDYRPVFTSGVSISGSLVTVLLGLIFSFDLVAILTYGFTGFCFKVDTTVCLSIMLILYLILSNLDSPSPLFSSFYSKGSATLKFEFFPGVRS